MANALILNKIDFLIRINNIRLELVKVKAYNRIIGNKLTDQIVKD